MIARIRGTVWEKLPNRVVVDTGGVGYELLISTTCAGQIGAEGDAVELLVWTQVREDAIQLFGFALPEERELFLMLVSVNNVGPKLALGALSVMTAADLAAAVRSEDLARITRIPGVGKKTAERILIELRDKIDRLQIAGAASAPRGRARDQAAEALVNLGYSRPDADKALQQLPDDLAEKAQLPESDMTAVSELIRGALRNLGGKK